MEPDPRAIAATQAAARKAYGLGAQMIPGTEREVEG